MKIEKSLLIILKSLLFRLRKLPVSFWFNRNIGRFTSIDRRYIAITGRNCITIGCKSIISAGARIEAIQSYAGKKYSPRIIIGDGVCINQNFHCTSASLVCIGAGTSITANCGIFDIIHPYDDIHTNPREQDIKVKPVIIGENCLIGMNSVILPGVNLGKHVIVGANSTVLNGNYKSYSVLIGSPARVVKRFDVQNNMWRKTDDAGNFIF